MAHVTKKVYFKFYLVLINLDLNNHLWLVATVLDSTAQTLRSIGRFCRWGVTQLDFSLREFVKDGDSWQRMAIARSYREEGP